MSRQTHTKEKYIFYFVNKFSWLEATPMATVSTMSTYASAQQGYQSTLIIQGDPQIDTNKILKDKFGLMPIPNYSIHLIKRNILRYLKVTWIFYIRACLIILSDKKDAQKIVISRNTTFLPYLKILRFFGCKTYFESHSYHGDLTIAGVPPRPKRRVFELSSNYRRIERLFLNSCKGLICIARPKCELYKKDFLKIPAIVLPLGAKAEKPRNLPEFEKRHLIYIGRLTPYVDVNVMIEAMKIFRSAGIQLTWIGLPEKDRLILNNKIQEHRLTDVFQVKGWMPHHEMVQYIQNEAGVGLACYKLMFLTAVLASPTKVFDYFAMGLPVIASRMPTTEDILEEKKHGFLYNPGNANNLAEMIQKIFSDKNLYNSIQQEVLSAAQYYSWENRAKRLIQFVKTTN
jgi:glycosyltransferase involved in cell wall biosynthesis